MAIMIGRGTRVLFTGDSITDTGRRDGVGDGLDATRTDATRTDATTGATP
ncbi:hypothetical protein [Labedella populi]|nr:hypothetical protein [Labedella populi]